MILTVYPRASSRGPIAPRYILKLRLPALFPFRPAVWMANRGKKDNRPPSLKDELFSVEIAVILRIPLLPASGQARPRGAPVSADGAGNPYSFLQLFITMSGSEYAGRRFRKGGPEKERQSALRVRRGDNPRPVDEYHHPVAKTDQVEQMDDQPEDQAKKPVYVREPIAAPAAFRPIVIIEPRS